MRLNEVSHVKRKRFRRCVLNTERNSELKINIFLMFNEFESLS